MDSTSLQKVEFSPEIEQDAQLKSRLRRASDALAQVVGTSAARVRARWKLATDEQGRSVVELELSDSLGAGTVSTEFAGDEFDNHWHLRRRLYSLWGDLLQHRSQRQFKELREAVEQLEGT